MRVVFATLLIGCSASSEPSRPPGRERDVLIEASGVTVIYRDGDGDWQLAPQVGSRLGFDLASEHYAVAFLDVSSGSIESIQTTRTEQVDFTRSPAPPEAPRHRVTGNVAGLGEIGGTFSVGAQTAVLVDGAAALDVPDGLHTIAVGRSDRTHVGGQKVSSLALRRDVLLQEPLEVEIDLIDALPTTESLVLPLDCQFRSTYITGGTAIMLGDSPRTVIAPHRMQWRAGDVLAVRQICRSGVYQTNLFHSLGEVPPSFETASPGGFGSFDEEARQFEWTVIDRDPKVLRGVLGGDPCDSSELFFEEYSLCQQRWTADVTAGWAAATSARTLPPISPTELEALGVWDPALALQLPAAWSFEARRESSTVISRSVTVGTFTDLD